MATAENTINTFQYGRELKVVPDMYTKHGAEIMLGLCTLLDVETQRKGYGVIGIFEKPIYDTNLKPKPIGYLVFKVGTESIVCSMSISLKEMAFNQSLPSWVSEINEVASGNGGNGLQTTSFYPRFTTERSERGDVVATSMSKTPQNFGDRRNMAIDRNSRLSNFPKYEYGGKPSKRFDKEEYTHLGLGELLVTQLESYAKSIGIKKIQFQMVNEYSGRLLNKLGYKGRVDMDKTLE